MIQKTESSVQIGSAQTQVTFKTPCGPIVFRDWELAGPANPEEFQVLLATKTTEEREQIANDLFNGLMGVYDATKPEVFDPCGEFDNSAGDSPIYLLFGLADPHEDGK